MDEKRFMKGIGDDVKVLVPVTEEEVFSIQPGNKEWVPVIEWHQWLHTLCLRDLPRTAHSPG